MNKPDFQVVVPCNLLLEKELDVSLRAFHWFFKSVTNRHQRRSILVAVGASEVQREIVDYFWKKTGLPPENLALSSHRNEMVTNDDAILVMPSQRLGDSARVEVIHWQLPTIIFENWERARSFDAGFCIFIAQNMEDQAVKEFGSFVRMLYFDLGALGMLRIKARGLRRGQLV